MPKISSSGAKGLIFGYAFRVIIFSAFSVVILSMLFSLIAYKLDLDEKILSYFSIAVTSASAVLIAYFSVKPFKNNGFLMGIISSLPLIIYSLINAIIFKNSAIFFLIKLVLMLALSALAGNFSIKRKKKFRVK